MVIFFLLTECRDDNGCLQVLVPSIHGLALVRAHVLLSQRFDDQAEGAGGRVDQAQAPGGRGE